MRRTLWNLMAGVLALSIEARIVAAAEATIFGQWCGDEGYSITVEGDAIRIHPRYNAYAAPAANIRVDTERVTYSQYYAEPDVTVNCTLLLTDSRTATETCDSPDDGFYPRPGESAVLQRCTPELEPEALPQPGV